MEMTHLDGCLDYRRTTRRTLLAGVGLSAVGWLTRSALAQVQISRPGVTNDGDVLVSIFLRGGMDGMSAIVPYAEDAYYRARPNTSLSRPTEGRPPDRVLDLDGFFGLHPSLAALMPLWESRKLAIVHAVGSNDSSRSHFEAMGLMERGNDGGSGWLARHLGSTPVRTETPLRAVAIASTMPDSLRGGTDALAIESLADFRLGQVDEQSLRRSIDLLYAVGDDPMTRAGRESLRVLDILHDMDPKAYKPEGGAVYPATDLGEGLKQVAMLLRAEVGLEVAALDKGGWDTHVVQGGSTGLLAGHLDDLGRSLAAFAADMGARMERVSVVVQTEFGRRLQENAGLGTDHGRASVMFLLGGGFKGGKVYGKWPGLADSDLEGPGDLRVTTDYRDILAEVLSKRIPGSKPSQVFPGYAPNILSTI